MNTEPTRKHHPRRGNLAGHGYFKRLGPGIVTGAADDDPSGIGTYSQVGAAFGLQLVWTTIVALPFAIAVQEATARLGLGSGKGLASLIKANFRRWVLFLALALVVGANTFNIGADLGSMAAATNLVVPVPELILVILFGLGIAALEIAVPYHRYSRILRWLCLSLVSYLVVLLIVDVAWADVASKLFVPRLEFDRSQIAALIAIFGTTISPYLFFWQTAEEVEELNDGGHGGLPTREQLAAMRGDVVAGMSSGVVTMFAIMVTAAATLHTGGVTSIGTAEEAAQALEPLAGRLAELVFTLGILGTGLLAVPVLAGSTSYAIAETFGWREGLSLKMSQARAFYWVIIASMFAGMTMNVLGLDPVRGLYWSAILNGVAAPPLIFMIFLLARKRSILGINASGIVSQVVVASAALLSAALPILYLFAR
ncbi:MAG: divalent metal cation transporter [Acidobacteria bacterium]|nr:divalent metal cation transporter [Acidobacteriota bacterium]